MRKKDKQKERKINKCKHLFENILKINFYYLVCLLKYFSHIYLFFRHLFFFVFFMRITWCFKQCFKYENQLISTALLHSHGKPSNEGYVYSNYHSLNNGNLFLELGKILKQ